MKNTILLIAIPALICCMVACSDDGNTGNGALDPPTLNPAIGGYPDSTTHNIMDRDTTKKDNTRVQEDTIHP